MYMMKQLVGFVNQTDEYPAIVVPIIEENSEFFAVFNRYKSTEKDFVKIECSFIHITPRPFNINHRIFAYSADKTSEYDLEHEREFFNEYLQTDQAKVANPFYMLSLAKLSKNADIESSYLNVCYESLRKTSQEFADIWLGKHMDNEMD